MTRKSVDNLELKRWRAAPAHVTLAALADHAKQDRDFAPRTEMGTTRWHATVGMRDIELLCEGPRFFDTRSRQGGGGAVDMAMWLLNVDFKQAVRALRKKGL
jgi:hypothetical protein